MVSVILTHMTTDYTVGKRLFLGRLLHAIVDCEIVQLRQIFMYTQNLLMLNSLLHLGFQGIALFLLLDEFLNFAGIHSRWHSSTILHLASFNHSLHLSLYIAICQVLLLEEELRVFAPQRCIVQGGLRRVGTTTSALPWCLPGIIGSRAIGAVDSLVEGCSRLASLLLLT